ncbi:hypothetical protein VNO78_16296 [Psophocarpus tetragonolobus]|uniref:Uncharacterized protein n=1 Tax=Psophocarpus tetragonolobus TaxID=3891 RepID=A0AAN9XKJ6_PSOTE
MGGSRVDSDEDRESTVDKAEVEVSSGSSAPCQPTTLVAATFGVVRSANGVGRSAATMPEQGMAPSHPSRKNTSAPI